MTKNLTNSQIDRQNILNNEYAVEEIGKAIDIKGVVFEGIIRFDIKQIARFFDVEVRTIERYLENCKDELSTNGYEIIKGNRLKSFIEVIKNSTFATDINVGSKTRLIGLFNFRSLLNLAMLLVESENAKQIRQVILDVVIDTINKKTGGNTKYINRRDQDFLIAYFSEENYRREFTDALRDFVDAGAFKYAFFTNKIYIRIFLEKANEYRNILRLQSNDKVRDTFYSEILDLVSSFECGFAEELESNYKVLMRKLTFFEAKSAFDNLSNKNHWNPLIEKVRMKMASRDYAFRDAIHPQLEEYITPLNKDEFEKFIGEKSMEFEKQLEAAKAVLKRLKER
jgi:hypothetical protein